MSDNDLVKRLRGMDGDSMSIKTLDEAADRIKELEAMLESAEQAGYANAMEAERKLHEDRIEELEAKLAKSVWRLEQMRDDRTGYRHPSHYIRGAAVTLAELKGGRDE
jgi:transcription elongation GreA/GreB family factor